MGCPFPASAPPWPRETNVARVLRYVNHFMSSVAVVWAEVTTWSLLSNHGRVLVFLARNPKSRLRDVAAGVDITERTAHRIVSELCEEGYVVRKRNGRGNAYEMQPEVPIHDPLLGDHWIGEILAVVAGTDGFPQRAAS